MYNLLVDYYPLNLEIVQLENRLELLNSRKVSFNLTTSENERFVSLLEQIDTLEVLYKIQLRNILAIERQLEATVNVLEPLERLIVRAKYFEGRSLAELALMLDYSYSQIKRIHKDAISKVNKMMTLNIS